MLAGGRHLGLLVVGGDLTLEAGASVIGAAVVRGTLRLRGRSGTVLGMAVAGRFDVAPGTLAPLPAVRFSRCAAAGALRAAAPLMPLQARPFAPMW